MKDKLQRYFDIGSNFPEILYLSVYDYELFLLDIGPSIGYGPNYIIFHHLEGETIIGCNTETPIGIIDKYIHQLEFNNVWDELMSDDKS